MEVGQPVTPHSQFLYTGIQVNTPGAPNEISWQISAPQSAYTWLARKIDQIQNPRWQTEHITIFLMIVASWHLKAVSS